jgi:hypothetical protein
MQNLVEVLFLLFTSEVSLAQQFYTAAAIEEKAPSTMFRASLVKVDITPKNHNGYWVMVHKNRQESMIAFTIASFLRTKARHTTILLTMLTYL